MEGLCRQRIASLARGRSLRVGKGALLARAVLHHFGCEKMVGPPSRLRIRASRCFATLRNSPEAPAIACGFPAGWPEGN